MNIGVYGGTFNPPHLGHLGAARFVIEALALDKLLFIPTRCPPHKPLPPGTPPPEIRRLLLEEAVDSGLPVGKAEVCTLELEREGMSYTADTLRSLGEQYPDDTLWLLVGEDMFLTLQDWARPQEIMTRAGICAFARRPETRMARLREQADILTQRCGARVELVSPPVFPISSTELRSLLAEGGGREYLPPNVYGTILLHGLYGTRADLKQLSLADLRACSYAMIRAKRIAHVRGTEEEAVCLAARWGANEEAAARAAILHDCTKYHSMESHLRLCEKYGIVLDKLERETEKLLHAKTGAAIARDWFGVSEDIYEAIYWHTTAKANMAPLEKIIYIADYIEPNRAFPEVEHLRALAYEDLDEAVRTGCELSIREMEARGRVVHPNTLQARAWLTEGKGF